MHNDARHFKTPQLETENRQANFRAYVDEAIRQARRDQPAELPNNHTVLYHRSFPIGSALADIFTHRAVRADIGNLMYAIETLTGSSMPTDTPEQQARRAVLAGFCWEISKLLKMGANGGFCFAHYDEGRALMQGIRNGRESDETIVRAMLEKDEGED